MSSSKDLMSVGEVAERSGIAISALHFYESKGLIRSVRDGRNQRRFERRELRIISFIKVAQRLGFTLEEIKEVFRDIPTSRMPTKKDWHKVTRAWDKALAEKIELATKLRNQLTLCIGCGCLSMKDCPLRNPDDELASKGPGAAML